MRFGDNRFMRGDLPLADPVTPTHVCGLLPKFLFLDHHKDLFIRKSRLHSSVLLVGGLYTNLKGF